MDERRSGVNVCAKRRMLALHHIAPRTHTIVARSTDEATQVSKGTPIKWPRWTSDYGVASHILGIFA
jgi:hypothetical protein